ncbi:MAG: hypothetical protein AVDCRST_MAG13-363, partial [uncultured Solirubrobacteraceae bacterium]
HRGRRPARPAHRLHPDQERRARLPQPDHPGAAHRRRRRRPAPGGSGPM